MKNLKLLIVFLFIISCGYKPIYQNNQETDFKLNEITYAGNKKLNRIIESNFNNLKDNNSVNVFNLDLTSTKKISIVTKDTKGNATSYKTRIDVKVDLTRISDKKIISKVFIKELTYNSMENKFELNQYKANLERNVMLQIYQEIITFLTLIKNDF
tara:strand:- start:423 stop:890 length:468 start_codon:yes stop_codon:yes gene_type:complete